MHVHAHGHVLTCAYKCTYEFLQRCLTQWLTILGMCMHVHFNARAVHIVSMLQEHVNMILVSQQQFCNLLLTNQTRHFIIAHVQQSTVHATYMWACWEPVWLLITATWDPRPTGCCTAAHYGSAFFLRVGWLALGRCYDKWMLFRQSVFPSISVRSSYPCEVTGGFA